MVTMATVRKSQAAATKGKFFKHKDCTHLRRDKKAAKNRKSDLRIALGREFRHLKGQMTVIRTHLWRCLKCSFLLGPPALQQEVSVSHSGRQHDKPVSCTLVLAESHLALQNRLQHWQHADHHHHNSSKPG